MPFGHITAEQGSAFGAGGGGGLEPDDPDCCCALACSTRSRAPLSAAILPRPANRSVPAIAAVRFPGIIFFSQLAFFPNILYDSLREKKCGMSIIRNHEQAEDA